MFNLLIESVYNQWLILGKAADIAEKGDIFLLHVEIRKFAPGTYAHTIHLGILTVRLTAWVSLMLK